MIHQEELILNLGEVLVQMEEEVALEEDIYLEEVEQVQPIHLEVQLLLLIVMEAILIP